MMKRLLWLVLAFAMQGAAWAADLSRSVTIALGDGSVRTFGEADGSVRVIPGTNTFVWSLDGFAFGDGSVIINPFTVIYENDPFVSWSIGARNNTDHPVSFSFAFSIPFAAGPYGQLTSNLSANVSTARTGSEMDLTSMSHDSLVDGIVDLSTVLPDCMGTVGPLDCGSVAKSVGVTTSGAGLLGSTFRFTLGQTDEIAAMGGSALTAPVPEPKTYALMLGGMLLLGAVAHRRGRA